jgi:small-conductance mechanosensitive channel
MQDVLEWVEGGGGGMPWLASLTAVIIAIAVALLTHAIIVGILRRAAVKREQAVLLAHAQRPVKWVLVVLAISIAQRAAPADAWLLGIWRQAAGLALPALVGWLAFELIKAVELVVQERADISVENNLEARRRRTRVSILARIAGVVILFLTLCMMLVSIPGVRNVGVTLMASAGLAGLAVGAAAQPALKNLIAGIQMAFTEPIRIDDVVIISGEWGRIEEIRLTYAVVRVWDERRLIVPISKFLEEPFQNWTRQSSQLLGSIFLYLDPTADIALLRAQLETVVKAQPLWDGRFFNLQVTDLKTNVMEVRALMTAADAGKAFDLRCAVREAMMAFITKQMPQALPRYRVVGEGRS